MGIDHQRLIFAGKQLEDATIIIRYHRHTSNACRKSTVMSPDRRLVNLLFGVCRREPALLFGVSPGTGSRHHEANPVRRSPASRSKTILFAGRRPRESKQSFWPVAGLTTSIQSFSPVAGFTKQIPFAGRRPHEAKQSFSPVAGLANQNNPFGRSPA